MSYDTTACDGQRDECMHAGRTTDEAGTCFGSTHGPNVVPLHELRPWHHLTLHRRCYAGCQCRVCTACQLINLKMSRSQRLGTRQVTCAGAMPSKVRLLQRFADCHILDSCAKLARREYLRDLAIATPRGLATGSQTEATTPLAWRHINLTSDAAHLSASTPTRSKLQSLTHHRASEQQLTRHDWTACW